MAPRAREVMGPRFESAAMQGNGADEPDPLGPLLATVFVDVETKEHLHGVQGRGIPVPAEGDVISVEGSDDMFEVMRRTFDYEPDRITILLYVGSIGEGFYVD